MNRPVHTHPLPSGDRAYCANPDCYGDADDLRGVAA